MRKLLQITKLILVTGFVFMCLSYNYNMKVNAEEDAYDFANNEEYYYDLCSNSGLSTDEKTACAYFRDYLAKKQSELDAEMEDLEDSISDLKANIKNEGQKIAQYTTQLDRLEIQITSIKNSIIKIENNIAILDAQILVRQERIDELDAQVKNSMVIYQANLKTNNYVKFVMGATSFIDLLRRINAVNEIVTYNHKKIDEMEQEKVLLKADLDELQLQKDTLVDQQSQLETKQISLNKLKAMTEELISSFEEQEAELIQQWDLLDEDFTELDKAITNIDKVLDNFAPSSEFGQFVKNKRIHITSGCYFYKITSGGFHAAIDVGNLGYGTPLYAIANGYVFFTGNKCPYNGGYLGNTCYGGRGNHVFIIVQIQNRYYSVYYEHLKDVNVKVGDLVYKGTTIIGTSGNSGNSSGPHLHFAIYYQGTTAETTIKDIAALYKAKGIRFGLKYDLTGTCDYRKNKAPCYLNPMEIYGYTYPNWYYVD